MKKFILVLAALAIGFSTTTAFAEGAGKKKGHGVTFKQADKDGNGSVTWEEFKGAHEEMLKMKFEKWDKDKDGALAQKEYWKGKKGMQGPKKKKMMKEKMMDNKEEMAPESEMDEAPEAE